VNNLSPNPSLTLPPVEPSKVLRSSPTPLQTPTFDTSAVTSQRTGSPEYSAKKARRGTIVTEPQGQTATPPPSARKGERKLAPKLDTAAMQNDQDFGQQAHFMASAHQQGMDGFVTAQGDMFGYPLSAPAAPPYGAQRSFWDPDPSLAGMDIDFSANGGGVFPPPTPHQGSGHVNWASANQLMPDQGGMAGHGDGHAPARNGQHSLVSQPPMSMLVTSSADHSMFATSYPTPVEDPFGMNDAGGAVNPGLIFSRPQSANMDAVASFHQGMPGLNTNMAVNQDSQMDSRGRPPSSKAAGRAELRRTASAKDATPRKQDRASASSPIKETGRPGLSRSFSENRGKKTVSRPSLPPLAPRPRSQLVGNAGVNANKPLVSQPQRPSGRSSPSKNSQHHHRLSSLSSIPETSGPEMRTQAKFMIDANGRARVETTVVVVEDEPSPGVVKRHSSYSVASHPSWDSDDDSSSTDDEPIVIPSRNTSFALPDPRKPTTIHPFHDAQRSISERSTTSYTSFQGGSQEAGDSDGETVVNELTPTRKASGDALSELRKLRETRQKQLSGSVQKRYVPSHYPIHPATSPTTMSDTSLPTPTPSTDARTRGVRCVCNSAAEASRNDLLVQWCVFHDSL
jgi:hypothetical protein